MYYSRLVIVILIRVLLIFAINYHGIGIVICSDSDTCIVRDGSRPNELAGCEQGSLLPKPRGPPSFILVLTILSYFNRKVPKAIGNMRTASRSVQWQDIAILTPFTLLMVVVLMCVRAPASANRPTDRTCSPTRLTPSRTSTMCTSWTCRQWRGHSASPYPRG